MSDDLQSQSVVLEIRAATGGEEAKLWASDLMRMYTRYAASKNWKVAPIGEGVIKIKGNGAFSSLQNEAGVHRVQRIPKTEKRGRVHTSTATVAVLSEMKDQEVFINPADLEWQFFRASSQGGQNVQKVSSAVRVIHKPSGIVVACQQERTQEQNRQIALTLLLSKLQQAEKTKKKEALEEAREAIGRGQRSEKIRTYNYPQNRVTDHRIGKSWKNLDFILEGNLDKVIKAF